MVGKGLGNGHIERYLLYAHIAFCVHFTNLSNLSTKNDTKSKKKYFHKTHFKLVPVVWFQKA